jgi:hypothetical protein
MPKSVLYTELSRRSIPGLAHTASRQGRDRFFDFGESFLAVLFGELRRLTKTNAENGNRAFLAARKVESVLRDLMVGKTDYIGSMVVVTHPTGSEQVVYVDSDKKLCTIQALAFQHGGAVYALALAPVVKKVLAELEKANDLPEGSLSSRIQPPPADWEPAPDEVPHVRPRAPSPSVPAPAVTDTRHGAAIYRVSRAGGHTAIITAPEGLEILDRGEGLRMRLTEDHWRELARRAEAVADEIAGRPRADLPALWSLESEVAGSA